MVYEAQINWTGPGHAPKLSLMYFEDGADMTTLGNFLDGFLTAWQAWACDDFGAQVSPTLRRLNTATGELLAEVPTPDTGGFHGGTVTTQPVPDAAQVLYRWTTGEVVAGRFLKGRTFTPGLGTNYLAGGNIVGSAQTAMSNDAQNVLESFPGLVIWSRTHGVAELVTGGTVWAELAVQRRRRG